MLREYCGMERELRGSRRMEFVFREPLGDALEILPTIKILVQALELWVTVNCHVKCPVWLLDM